MADGDWQSLLPVFKPFSEDNLENLVRLAFMVGGVLICLRMCYAEIHDRKEASDAREAAQAASKSGKKKRT